MKRKNKLQTLSDSELEQELEKVKKDIGILEYRAADIYREQIERMGYSLKDTPTGTIIKKMRKR